MFAYFFLRHAITPHRARFTMLAFLASISLLGCAPAVSDNTPADAAVQPPALDEGSQAAGMPDPSADPNLPAEPIAPGQPVAEPIAPPAAVAPAADQAAGNPDQPVMREKAVAGSGVQGDDIPVALGTTAARTYFLAKERIVFDVQIPSAMQLYKAEHGHAPKTHDDFMSAIVEAGQIQLPKLPPQHRYVYDPEKEELQVEHPQN